MPIAWHTGLMTISIASFGEKRKYRRHRTRNRISATRPASRARENSWMIITRPRMTAAAEAGTRVQIRAIKREGRAPVRTSWYPIRLLMYRSER